MAANRKIVRSPEDPMVCSDMPDKEKVPSRRYGLPARARLHKRREFLRLYNLGSRSSLRGFAVLALPNSLNRNRLGVSVTRKHGNAVERNRIRRIIKEAFRLENPELPVGFDFVCIPPRQTFTPSLDRLRGALAELAQSACRKASGRS